MNQSIGHTQKPVSTYIIKDVKTDTGIRLKLWRAYFNKYNVVFFIDMYRNNHLEDRELQDGFENALGSWYKKISILGNTGHKLNKS